jgi:hypothetical protein
LERPPWFGRTIDGIADLVADAWNEQQGAPSRAELSATIARVPKAIAAVERRCRDNPMLAAVLPRLLRLDPTTPDAAARLIAELSGQGRADIFTKFGWPTAKLLTACGVVALYRQVRGSLPDAKNRSAERLCTALLWRARERAGDLMPATDERVKWTGSLLAARRVYASNALMVLAEANALDYAAWEAAWRHRALIRARREIDDMIERSMR